MQESFLLDQCFLCFRFFVLYVNTISCNTKDIKSLEEGPCVKNKLHNNEGPTYST